MRPCVDCFVRRNVAAITGNRWSAVQRQKLDWFSAVVWSYLSVTSHWQLSTSLSEVSVDSVSGTVTPVTPKAAAVDSSTKLVSL